MSGKTRNKKEKGRSYAIQGNKTVDTSVVIGNIRGATPTTVKQKNVARNHLACFLYFFF